MWQQYFECWVKDGHPGKGKTWLMIWLSYLRRSPELEKPVIKDLHQQQTKKEVVFNYISTIKTVLCTFSPCTLAQYRSSQQFFFPKLGFMEPNKQELSLQLPRDARHVLKWQKQARRLAQAQAYSAQLHHRRPQKPPSSSQQSLCPSGRRRHSDLSRAMKRRKENIPRF